MHGNKHISKRKKVIILTIIITSIICFSLASIIAEQSMAMVETVTLLEDAEAKMQQFLYDDWIGWIDIHLRIIGNMALLLDTEEQLNRLLLAGEWLTKMDDDYLFFAVNTISGKVLYPQIEQGKHYLEVDMLNRLNLQDLSKRNVTYPEVLIMNCEDMLITDDTTLFASGSKTFFNHISIPVNNDIILVMLGVKEGEAVEVLNFITESGDKIQDLLAVQSMVITYASFSMLLTVLVMGVILVYQFKWHGRGGDNYESGRNSGGATT